MLNAQEKPRISVVIHTYNSERFLERVLSTVKDFDEILLCDMRSTDGTLAIAERFGARVISHEKLAFADPARDYAIHQAAFDWVLVVDSDELITPALRDELYAHIRRDNPEEGVRIPRRNHFMGRFMRGEYPDPILRFFRKERTVWPPHVHGQPIVDGRVRALSPARRDLAIIHLADPPVHAWIAKANLYTDLEIPKREAQSVSWGKLLFAPWFRFFKAFILKGGFRDGMRGYIYARLFATYKLFTLAKMYESRRDPSEVESILKPPTQSGTTESTQEPR